MQMQKQKAKKAKKRFCFFYYCIYKMYIFLVIFILVIVIAAYVYTGQKLPTVEVTEKLAEIVRNADNIETIEKLQELQELRPYLRRRMKPGLYYGEARERVASLNRLRYAIEFLISDYRCKNKIKYTGPLVNLIDLEQ